MLRFAILIIGFLPLPAQAQSRALITDGVDRFMLAEFDKIQPRSIAENREYCGYVGFNAASELAITGPRRGSGELCDPGDPPAGFDVLASWHTHGAFNGEAASEVPSVGDMLGDFAQGIDGYVATPGGRVWLNLASEKLTYQLCGRGCVASDPKARPCPAFVPAVEYTLAALRARVAKDDGSC